MNHSYKRLISAISAILCFSLITGCSQVPAFDPASLEVSIVPAPLHVERHEGAFVVTKKTVIKVDDGNAELTAVGSYLAGVLKIAGGHSVNIYVGISDETEKAAIRLTLTDGNPDIGNEGYTLNVTADGVTISANTATGAFYGVQTLLQLLPAEIASGETIADRIALAVPCVSITDKPRFPWRGLHVDVSRHFFPPETLKKLIDLMAMHKLNVFHWHLTDGTGWRLEIDKYPRLTEIGAWRKDIRDEQWIFNKIRSHEAADDGEPYGGYYTKDEVRDIVEYARDLHIDVLPEIEMPGHSHAALAAYPELLCTDVESTHREFGNSGVFCAGKEETFAFLEGVLDEVIELFPCEYLHIGGDEVPKRFWKACPDCQARIKSEGLKDEDELQSYFISRMEKHLIARGKRLVGWDEILEGGLAPEATVMCWRGTKGGIEAAKQGHDVIITPSSHTYFNLYQGDPDFEPKAWGGFTPLNKVYGFDPVPDGLSVEDAKYIIGSQGCVWTEFIQTPDMLEYMLLPRLSAIAEVVWTDLSLRDFEDFKSRMIRQYSRFDAMGFTYARSAFNIGYDMSVEQSNYHAEVVMKSDAAGTEIRYELDGSDPTAASTLYTGPVTLSETAFVKAGSFVDGELAGKVTSVRYNRHKATGRKVTLENPYSSGYPGAGDYNLTNCLMKSSNYADGQWQAFLGQDMVAVIDLETDEDISRVAASFIHKNGVWIFMPERLDVSVSSDGVNFTSVASVENDTPQTEEGPLIKEFAAEFATVSARYVKVRAKTIGVCPDWHAGAGGAAFIFADEIIVE